MRRLVAWPMTLMWLAMGVLVTLGFYSVRVEEQRRCEAGNDFRRNDLPAAFDEFSLFLGQEFQAEPERVDDARARFAVVMDDLFPERDCSLLW